jgi:hypothetical protein
MLDSQPTELDSVDADDHWESRCPGHYASGQRPTGDGGGAHHRVELCSLTTGTYKFYCGVIRHEDMQGTVTVRVRIA